MIEVQDLTKRYGSVEAVRQVSFTVDTGQIVGLLGPNGAGKTTVMKVLTGYHYPTEGDARIDGFSVLKDSLEVKRRIGYLPENAPLYTDLTPREYLQFVAEARQLPREKRRARINEVLVSCGIETVQNRPIETLSKGYRQRVGLAQAILHDPPILILDEPTTGLDPNQIIEIRNLIRELGTSKTVILSTHILQEVEAVCSQVLIIHEGRIAAQGTTEEIAATLKGGNSWVLIVKGIKKEDPAPKMQALPSSLSLSHKELLADGTMRLHIVETTGGQGASVEPLQLSEALFDWAVGEGLKILEMQRQRLSLEDIFVRLTTEGKQNETTR
ncbi:MAG: ATP-binding cassette domain-containing protein [Treponemataceae bacterium]|nr:ATP-binding cassette domain-containing protein [Treponemataceae bacterium]